MCFGLAFMLAGVILGGAYLYKYFAFQVSQIHFIMGGVCFSLVGLTFRREEYQIEPKSIATPILIFLKAQFF